MNNIRRFWRFLTKLFWRFLNNLIELFWYCFRIIRSVITAYIVVVWMIISNPSPLTPLQKICLMDLSKEDYTPFAALLTVGVILLHLCGQWIRDGYRHYYFANRYGIISVFVSIILFWAIDCYITAVIPCCSFRELCLIISIVCFVFILFCCWCYKQLCKKDEPPTKGTGKGKDTDITKWSAKQILKWAKKEKPIDVHNDDYFGMTKKAKRIAKIIRKNEKSNEDDSIPNCSIGLKGAFGAGKTSLIRLIKEKLNKNTLNRYIFCEVSCWGFSESSAALQFILDQITIVIANEGINTDDIRGLSTKYRNIVTGGGSLWERLFSTIFINEFDNTPEKILDNLIKLLKREQCHLILVMEDIDRNKSKHFPAEAIFGAIQKFKEVKSNLSLILAGYFS
jgi:hypothetical protein